MLTLNLEALLPEDATDPTQNANPATTSMKMPSPMNNGKSAETSEMPPAQSWSPQNSEIAKELEMISPRSSGISLCIYRKLTGAIYELCTKKIFVAQKNMPMPDKRDRVASSQIRRDILFLAGEFLSQNKALPDFYTPTIFLSSYQEVVTLLCTYHFQQKQTKTSELKFAAAAQL